MTFSHYREEGDAITAVFADGSEVTGDMLVGADASRSRVRRQRFPTLRREDLGILNIAGRYPLDDTRRPGLPSWLIDGSLNNIVPSASTWMFTSAWLLGSTTPSRHHGENSDYVVWAFASSRRSYPHDVNNFDPEQLRDYVLTRINGWAPALKQIVRDSDATSIARIPLHSMPVLTDWMPSRVTLIGDAIQNMTPMAGVGANTAFRDAAVLSESLAQLEGPKADPTSAIARYERAMRAYAIAAVTRSRDNARRATSGSVIGRRAFRTSLASAERIPVLKRWLFSSR